MEAPYCLKSLRVNVWLAPTFRNDKHGECISRSSLELDININNLLDEGGHSKVQMYEEQTML